MELDVTLPPDRIERWISNFGERHGGVDLCVDQGCLLGDAPDGSRFVAQLSFERRYNGSATIEAFASEAGRTPDDWGVVLVRKGGFAIARLAAATITESKVGQRHVQGRTKAGGQSQQRFARRRDNQARQAYEAATEHAVRILGALHGPVVTGGDRAALAEVLADPRLARHPTMATRAHVADPRRAVLDQVILDAMATQFAVTDTQR